MPDVIRVATTNDGVPIAKHRRDRRSDTLYPTLPTVNITPAAGFVIRRRFCSWISLRPLGYRYQTPLGRARVDQMCQGPPPAQRTLQPEPGLELTVQVNRGGYPGNVAHDPSRVTMARHVFSKVDISGAQSVDRPVGEPNLRFPRQCDYVLSSWSHVPIAEVPRLRRPEYDSLGVLQLTPRGVGGRVDLFNVRFAIVARI